MPQHASVSFPWRLASTGRKSFDWLQVHAGGGISDRAVRDQDVEFRDQRQAAGWPFWCSSREKQPSPEFRVLWSTPLTLSRRRWLFDLVWESVLQTFNTRSLSLFLSVVLRSALVWLSVWLCVYIWLCVYSTYELPECVCENMFIFGV